MKCELPASLLAITGVAFMLYVPADAADLTAAPLPQPAVSWTGFYVCANLGGVLTKENSNLSGPLLGSSGPSPFDSNPGGVVGGVGLGYNLQFAPQWLIGIEGEFEWTTGQDVSNQNDTTQAVSFQSDHNWYDTAFGRLGYIMGPVMVFAKGGAAWMDAHYSLTTIGPVAGLSAVTARPTGWTAGGGLEAFIMPNWSAKLEYDFLDFGNKSYSFPIAGGTSSTISVQTQVHQVKLGINYHLPAGASGF